MMRVFNIEKLTQVLSKIDMKGRIIFSASCCDRLFPNYVAFHRETNWGRPDLFKDALEIIWNYLAGKYYTDGKILQIADTLEAYIPNTEDFESIYTSSALDASNAIQQTLLVLNNGDIQKIVDVASFARDTVDMYIQIIEELDYNDPDFEHKILHHPLMARELEKQDKDLQLLLSTQILDSEFILKFRKQWNNDSRSNIDIK